MVTLTSNLENVQITDLASSSEALGAKSKVIQSKWMTGTTVCSNYFMITSFCSSE